MTPPGTIAVVGTGLIGASVGLAARRAGVAEVIGVDADPANAAEAVRVRAVTRLGSLADLAADLTVVCVPVGRAAEVVNRLPASAGLATDAASVKGPVVRDVTRPRFVPAHPMAGSERSGPSAARADLFDDAACYVFGDGYDADRAAAFWESLGCRVRREVTAGEHDALMAAVSHLPHAVAGCLVVAAGDAAGHAGPGFRDSTRVAAGDPDLWADILLANRHHLIAAAAAFAEHLDDLRAAIARGDRAAVREALGRAATRRRTLDQTRPAGAVPAGRVDSRLDSVVERDRRR